MPHFSAKHYSIKSQKDADRAKSYADSINPETLLHTDTITNCITEIPQDIKLELVDGTLTLKAGSKVYVPNGVGVFDAITVDGDKNIFDTTKNGKYFLMYGADKNAVTLVSINDSVSGVGAVPNVGLSAGYDTNTNIIKRYNGDLSVAFNLCSFPLVATTWVAGSGCVSIDQVFNGFGYIGKTIYALPGVKGLIPNGRNADGSLKNTEFTVGKVLTHTDDRVNYPNGQLILRSDYIQRASPRNAWKYYEAENLFVYTANGDKNWMDLGTYITDSNGVMTSFQPKLPFRAVDQNDFNKLNKEVTTLDAQNAKLNGFNLYTGSNEFKGTFKLLAQSGNEGAQIDWKAGSNSTLENQLVSQDILGNKMRFFARNSAGVVMHPLMLDFETGTATAITPPAADNSTQIATTAWVNTRLGGTNVTSTELGYLDGVTSNIQTQLNGTIKTSGNQTWTGVKTAKHSNIQVQCSVADDTATSISANEERGLLIIDKDGARIGNFFSGQLTSGKIRTYMCSARSVSGTMKYQYAEIQQNTDGTGTFNISCTTATSPTPAVADNSTKIATTAWVNNKHKVVSALPSSPDANTFYYIPE